MVSRLKLYLGIEIEDTRRVLSEFDALLDLGFPVLAGNYDNKYMIPLIKLGDWLKALYLSAGTMSYISKKISDVKFSLCTAEGKVYKDLTEKQQNDLRVGIDSTFVGSTGFTYHVQSMANTGPKLTITLCGCQYVDRELSDFQKALDDPTTSKYFDGINSFLFGAEKGRSYELILDMYRKGYIKLSSDQLEWWDNVKKLGL